MRTPGDTTPLVAWRGPSFIDGTLIRAIVYTRDGSLNPKIGPMAQVAFVPDDQVPHEAVKSGRDAAVCGDCIHRTANLGTCYVNLIYLRKIWEMTVGVPADLEAACRALRARGLPLRLGSWGDPASAPFEATDALVRSVARDGKPRHTGYTHQWRSCDGRHRRHLVASVDSEGEHAEARNLGWRTFRVRAEEMPVLPGEMVCPASPEGGEKATCSACAVCNGASSRRDVVVIAHGLPNKTVNFKRHLRVLENDELRRSIRP